MKRKQEKLIQLYNDTVWSWDVKKDFSSPHLISLNSKDISTDIMFVGQETNAWYGNWNDFKKRGVIEQMSIYEQFLNTHYHNMNNLFFKYIKNLINNSNIIPVWTNMFKFDLGDSSHYKNISKLSQQELSYITQLHNNLLAKEIEIIQPKIIVFFTGHKYDKLFVDPVILKNQDYELLYKNIDELSVDEWKCCELGLTYCDGFEHFEGTAYRTYHPMYLNRNINTFAKEILDFLNKQINHIIN